jgi:hypothetical protein
MKTINVMGIFYEIVQLKPEAVMEIYKDTDHYEHVQKMLGEKGQDFAGLCDAQQHKIYINIDLSYEKKKKTLIHEFVEALDQESVTELAHVVMQAITNAFFIAGIIDIEELLKVEPEDIEISIDSNSA